MDTNSSPSQPPPSPSPLKPVNTTTAPTPTATPTTPTSSGSLYHLCRSVLDKLSTIDGMQMYLEQDTTSDPLSKLTKICRQGFPLCTLYNALKPVKPLSVDSDPNLNALNSCKANVYHFIVACIRDLSIPEEEMFTISDLFQDDTTGFVKVVNTINKLLLLLENRGIITVRSSNRNSDNSDPNPKNTRDKVVLELLETERKYVQDMEILQNYMRELQTQKIVSADTIHYLFGNLNALVDFQRRFLIQLEEIAEKSPEEQRIGHLFITMEESFSVYEPYCANYYSAQDLVVQETPRLQKLAEILNPIYELPSMLIKPVQRICKYPLLLQELLKSTDKTWPHYQETQASVDAIKRVTEKVNETQRQHENVQKVQELKKRLDDWKEIRIDGYGNLMLQDKLIISTNATESNERDLHVFFFEKALLFCKESKGNNLLPKSNTLSINKKKRRGSLVPKYVFYTSNMADMNSKCCKNGVWCLVVDLKNSELEQISLKFRNEEQLKLWTCTLTKAIQKAIDVANENDQLLSNQLSSTYTDGEDEEEGENDFFDDEEDDYHQQHQQQQHQQQRSRSSSFNQQPMIRGKIGPIQTAAVSQDKYNVVGRPYHNVPGMNLSPLPRSNSSLTTSSILSTSPPSLLNCNYYPASPPPSHPSSPTSSSRVSSTSTSAAAWHRHDGLTDIATNFLTGDYTAEDYHQHYLIQQQKQQQPFHQHSLLITGRSQSQSAAVAHPSTLTRPTLPINQNRLRSQSSPNIMKNNGPGHTVPMTASSSTATTSTDSTAPGTPTMSEMPQLPTRSANMKPTPLDLSRSYHQHQETIISPPLPPPMMRSVASTPRLSDIAMTTGAAPPSPGAIKIKLNFNDGIYVIVTNHEVTFFELMEKVDKKIRLVANLKSTDLLRLKYQDEDCDFITINSDDDVQMAFESRGIHNTVNLFVSL
ncbi:uncharacterized protein ATC70_002236 [Mucor velutinosus]|uniref:Uncharacterized protein n=1 Tax=Mucor velutinosus TaxID=708070 RepID=A0AAN7DHH4_9FUNG|nr:hypothetical protein ATC70_002236 [Mucor velutinosus]